MSAITDHLKARIEEIEAEVKALEKELEGYRAALAAEFRRNGRTTIQLGMRVGESLPLNSRLPPDVVAGRSAARFIELLLKENRIGLSYKEILKGLEDFNYKVHPNYHYHVVSMLREAGKVEERDGRFYWKEGMPKDSAKASAE
jgi:hypothetical protein